MLQAIPSTFLSDQARFEGKSMGELASQVLASRVLCSSVGNIDKLGPLRRWRPSTATAESTLVIDRLILTVRMSTPTICCMCYQYDGQLTLHLAGSSRHNSKEAWQYFGDAIRSRILHIIATGSQVV